MNVVITAAALILAVAAPAAAQSASARMGASASVVAPVRVDDAAVAVSRSGAGIDVTRPLAVDGPVSWVLEVVAGAAHDLGAERLAVHGGIRSAAAGADQAPGSVTIRLPAHAAPDRRILTYVVATVN